MRRGLAALFACASSFAHALDGVPDFTYNGSGNEIVAYTGLSTEDDSSTAVCLQPDQKIVVFGTHRNVNTQVMKVIRLLPNGGADPAFTTATISSGGFPAAVSCALQPDGKIVFLEVFGTRAPSEFVVYRLNVDGTPDTGFGPGGRRAHAFDLVANPGIVPVEVRVQADGRILLVGSYVVSDLAGAMVVMRLDPTGAIDGTYGTRGQVLVTRFSEIQSGTPRDFASSAQLRPDGNLLIAGGTARTREQISIPLPPGTTFVYRSHAAFALVGPTGAMVSGFGNGGVVDYDTGTDLDGLAEFELAPDGRIVAFGYPRLFGGLQAPLVLRFNATGGADFSFGQLGRAAVTVLDQSLNWPLQMSALAVQDDGRIVLAGSIPVFNVNKTAVVRLLENGTPDPSFGDGTYGPGAFVRRLNLGGVGFEDALGVRIQQGKPVVVGRVNHGFGNGLQYWQYVMRLTGPGPLLSDGFEGP